ncbi:uncharacterized protein METZ01_LOCUS384545, partial [marine metagenome]
ARFSRDVNKQVLAELQELNRFFKNQHVNEKVQFINNRINSVENDLESSEKILKSFREQNQQISSPALQLEFERFTRDVEIQKEIYLTLKQQLELAKIEEIQKDSVLQILDEPQIPLNPSGSNLKLSVLLAGILGISLGMILGFVRSYIKTSDIEERKKLRRIKSFIKKKGKDFLMDKRISGILSVLLLIGLPFYLGHRSQNPVFFNMYSNKFMFVNIVYILILFFSIGLFFHLLRKKVN